MKPRLRPCLALLLALPAAGCGVPGGEGSLVAGLWRQMADRLGLAGAAPEAAPPGTAGPAEPADPGDGSGTLDAVAQALGADVEPEESGPGYWRYTEPGGSVRFVQSLAEVPPEARGSAQRIDTFVAPAARRPARQARPAPRLRRPRPAAPEPAPARRDEPAVVVYTTSWCGWCRKTLAWLDERGVAYENRDIERNPAWAAELARKTGGQSIPVVDVDGRIVRGFDPETLAELL